MKTGDALWIVVLGSLIYLGCVIYWRHRKPKGPLMPDETNLRQGRNAVSLNPQLLDAIRPQLIADRPAGKRPWNRCKSEVDLETSPRTLRVGLRSVRPPPSTEGSLHTRARRPTCYVEQRGEHRVSAIA